MGGEEEGSGGGGQRTAELREAAHGAGAWGISLGMRRSSQGGLHLGPVRWAVGCSLVREQLGP